MFEHCWLIVLRGKMLRRLPAALLRRDRLAPSPALRAAACCTCSCSGRTSRSSRASGVVYDVAARAQLAFLALAALRRRDRRATTCSSPGRRSSRSGTTCAAACRRRGTRPRGRGDGRGGRRARPRVPDQDARQPVPRCTADPLPDPAVPARGRAGARSTRRRLQLGALDDRRRARRLAGDRDRPRRRSRSVRRGGWRSSSSVDAEYVVGDARELPFADGVVRRRLLVQRAPASRQGGRARCGRRDPPGACGPSGLVWIEMPNARGPLNLVRQARRGFSAGTGQDVRYWTLGELRETFGAIGPVSITADGFLTINPQTADLDLLRRARRLVVRVSDAAAPCVGPRPRSRRGCRQRGRARPEARREPGADVALASVGCWSASPLLAAGALAVKLEDGGPVLYRQRRVGKDGEEFELLKLRTMVVGAEKIGAGYAVDRGDPRITRTGRLLRRLSIDELPQLWNVVRGDMSVIGPRPTLGYQVERYDERQRRRLEVKPGITGWAQIHGRASRPLGGPDRAGRLVRRAPLAEGRPRDPRAHTAGPVQRHVQGHHGRLEPQRLAFASLTTVLFTCAGQRVDIVSAFRRAGARTVAVDADPLAPALYHAHERAIVPLVDHPGYLPALQELVREHECTARDPARRPRPPAPRRAPRRARRSARAPACSGGGQTHRGQVRGPPVLRAARHPLAGELAARRAAGRALVPGARQAPARLRLARTSIGPRIARSSTSTFAARLPSRSCSRSASVRSSRSTSSATSRAAASARSRGR